MVEPYQPWLMLMSEIITVVTFIPVLFSSFKMGRTYNEELKYLEKVSANSWKIKKGFVPNMKVRDYFVYAEFL